MLCVCVRDVFLSFIYICIIYNVCRVGGQFKHARYEFTLGGLRVFLLDAVCVCVCVRVRVCQWKCVNMCDV